MIRPLCVYLAATATLLLLVGLFLPAGRGVWVMEFSAGQANQVAQFEAEEMGCTKVPASSAASSSIVFFTELKSFFIGGEVMCGKSPLSMLMTGKYLLPNLLLILPAPLAVIAMLQIVLRPFSRHAGKRALLLTGVGSLVFLLLWWTIWVKFRAIPALGFWVSLIGAILLFTAGILEREVDPFLERRHPHPA